MKERPILFSEPMVRAILEGRKTQTRRIVKGRPENATRVGRIGNQAHIASPEALQHCPYGKPGEKLWIRETFSLHFLEDGCLVEYKDGKTKECIGVNGPEPDWHEIHWAKESDRLIAAGATYDETNGWSGDAVHLKKMRPSLFMPRWASRITLEIVSVRVERLQDISEEDAKAEGVKICHNMNNREGSIGYVWPDSAYDKAGLCHSSAITAFSQGWDSINKDRAAWESNPWVWAISFKVVA